MKIGPGGSQAEEVRAGEYVEAHTKLSSLIESTRKSTTYFAWGDERNSKTLQSTFVAELAIEAADGKSTLASAWSSIIGLKEIPFDKEARAEMMRKAGQCRNIAGRIEKWTNYTTAKPAQPTSDDEPETDDPE